MKTITQKIIFPIEAKVLYETYLSSKKHSEAIGSLVKVTPKVGAAFSSWDGYISGKIILLKKESQIVQTWRASDWTPQDPDSILSLYLKEIGNRCELLMIHSGVPISQANSLAKGWQDYYWKPWKLYFTTSVLDS